MTASAESTWTFDHIELRGAQRQLLVDGAPATLGGRAFDLLVALVERRDRTVPKNELFDLVWPGVVVEENNLQVQVSALRKLLGPQAIATIPGRGYRFAMAPACEAPPPGAAVPARTPTHRPCSCNARSRPNGTFRSAPPRCRC